MASPEAIRAMRSIARASSRSFALQRQTQTTCSECLASRSAIQRTNSRRRPWRAPVGRSAVYRSIQVRALSSSAVYRKETGPIAEYDHRVQSGRLRDDEHQRNLIQALQDLHETLSRYNPPGVVRPTIESLQPKKKSFFGLLGGGGGKLQMRPRPDLPKGLYMYGDVGSGKTMLMDLFYDTLPDNITHKTRIHFHNFMQEVHKELHKMKMQHGNDIDCIPFVAATFAEKASVLCFDEFQCTDVADAMILRRLIESLMAHGTVIVTTSNRHPTELYKNGIQRESFVPCINLLLDQLRVLNLDSTTDYRKIPRPPSGVYHHPLDTAANRHAEHWFKFLGDFDHDPPHAATQTVWGREITVPRASGKACWFTFNELIGSATGAADYLELVRHYDRFIVTDVPGMNLRSRDLARRFITFLDAVYESRAKLVLTSAVPLTQLFMSRDEVGELIDSAAANAPKLPSITSNTKASKSARAAKEVKEGSDVDDAMRMMMDDLGMNMDTMKKSSMFTGDEEAFAFARALSRLTEMGSQEWVERGLGMEHRGGEKERADWTKVKGQWHQDSY
ncbi:probable AFG1-ATPase family gene [Lecanosticta acicola]|uniref:Probable AFG1-ATPase family protein n=1 Tax=Lecanosticta acicola TaxID=111012 RepID=A0AAI9EBF7_9PEZI|nr:probable AFG1-ATPase family gene [Lecanosticta acicola]